MSFGYDPELPAGFQDADIEQADFERQSREFSYQQRRMEDLRAMGEYDKAADTCAHSGGYPLDSRAALDSSDPNACEKGWRCSDCGSRLTDSAWNGGRVVVPCELRKDA